MILLLQVEINSVINKIQGLIWYNVVQRFYSLSIQWEPVQNALHLTSLIKPQQSFPQKLMLSSVTAEVWWNEQ